MFGAYGGMRTETSVTFVSQAFVDNKLAKKWGLRKRVIAVADTRDGVSKKKMIHNDATPNITIDPETYEVRADGELLVCEPAKELPMAQRYFLF